MAQQLPNVNVKEARREYVSEWLLECSVLWAVFPLLDELVEKKPIDIGLMAVSAVIASFTFVLGIVLRRGGHE